MTLKADKTNIFYGVHVKEYVLTKHNPNDIAMPRNRSGLVGITIHNTPKISVSGTTMAEQYTRATVNGNMGDVRVHFYVDETEAWQNLPLESAGWHATDGDGDGNMKTIAIECIMDGSDSATSKKAEDNCARLTAWLLDKFKLSNNAIYSHNHWYSKKYCPAYILPHWDSFKKKCISYRSKNTEKPVLDVTGYKKGDETIGSLLLKKYLKLAKDLGFHNKGFYDNAGVGDGTINAVNAMLKKWGYKENGIAGKNFINKLALQINSTLKSKGVIK